MEQFKIQQRKFKENENYFKFQMSLMDYLTLWIPQSISSSSKKLVYNQVISIAIERD